MHLVRKTLSTPGPIWTRLVRREDGFQTAEAIGISAVGLLVLFAIWGALSVLGVDVIDWIRSFGVGSSSPLPPPAA